MKLRNWIAGAAIIVIGGTAQTAPLTPQAYIESGINIDAIPWDSFCKGVQPVSVTRAGVTCSVVHPSSDALRHYVDLLGNQPIPPPPACDLEALHFKRATSPQDGGQPWNYCKESFRKAIRLRSGGRISYDDMPFEQWRSKYFTPWFITPGAKK